MAETIEQKSHRALTEGRLNVIQVDPNPFLVIAECKGFTSGEIHRLGHDPAGKGGQGEWRCTCEARGRCWHLVALQLVVPKPTGRSV